MEPSRLSEGGGSLGTFRFCGGVRGSTKLLRVGVTRDRSSDAVLVVISFVATGSGGGIAEFCSPVIISAVCAPGGIVKVVSSIAVCSLSVAFPPRLPCPQLFQIVLCQLDRMVCPMSIKGLCVAIRQCKPTVIEGKSVGDLLQVAGQVLSREGSRKRL